VRTEPPRCRGCFCHVASIPRGLRVRAKNSKTHSVFAARRNDTVPTNVASYAILVRQRSKDGLSIECVDFFCLEILLVGASHKKRERETRHEDITLRPLFLSLKAIASTPHQRQPSGLKRFTRELVTAMSAYARSALLPPARSNKKSKPSTNYKNAAFRAPLRNLPPLGQIQKDHSRNNLRNGDGLSQPSSEGSSMQSQPRGLPSDGNGTRQYQSYGSSIISAHSNAPIQECVYSNEPFSQLTMPEFSQHSSAKSISHDSIVNHPELHQRSQTSSASGTSASSNRFSYLQRGFANINASSSSRAPSVSSSQSSAGQSLQAPHLNYRANLQAQALQSRKTTRPWMIGLSDKTFFMSKPTSLRTNGFNAEPTPFRKEPEIDGDGGLSMSSRWSADHTIKLQQENASTVQERESSEAKCKSLITHHFKPVILDNHESSPSSEVIAPQGDGMAALNEKQRELEKLASEIDTKMQAFNEKGTDELAKKQRELEKLASELDIKMRTFNEKSNEELARSIELRNRLEEQSNDALQRVYEASIEAVETINGARQSGVDALTNLVADARDAAAQMKRKLLEEVMQATKKLVPSLFEKKAVTSASDPHYGAEPSYQEHNEVGSQSSSGQSREISVPPIVQTTYRSTRTLGHNDSATNRVASKVTAPSSKRAGTAETPARQSKRLKTKAMTHQSPKVTTPVRNSKAFCVTPSARSASQVAPPVRITFSRGTSIKKSIEKVDSTPSKNIARTTMSAKHVLSRRRKKPRVSSLEEEVQLSWTVSESDSSSSTSLSQASSRFYVSPPTKTLPTVGRTARRRMYGKQRRTIETSFVDEFSFLGSV
jgi:hypothetical protein